MTKAELRARVRVLEAREAERREAERRRTAAARAKRLENRRAERQRLARQVRLAAVEDGSARSQRQIVDHLRGFGWHVSRGTVAALLRGPRL